MTSFLSRRTWLTWSLTLVATTQTLAQTRTDQAPDKSDMAPLVDGQRPAPRYLLLGSNNRPVESDDFQGRFQLITFGYVSCPDVCPTTMTEMKQVLTALGPRARQLQPIFITIDPERDTVAVLKAYTENFDSRILGLTGSADLTRWAANNFKVEYTKIQVPGAAPSVYTMDHTAGMFLLGPDGQLLKKFGYSTQVAGIISEIKTWMDTADKLDATQAGVKHK